MKITVIGAGTWGTALSLVLCRNHHDTILYGRNQEEIKGMRRTGQHRHLPGVTLPETLCFSSELFSALRERELVVMAVPSIAVRETARKIRALLSPGCIVLSVAKGIEEETLYSMSQILKEELPEQEIAALSGPSHAEEVAKSLPTAICVSAVKLSVAERVQDIFMEENFRVYLCPDLEGMELGGAMKNVIALAAGISDGLQFGDNTRAALMTRGISEIAHLGVKMDCRMETFAGLSGIGDLMVTCSSAHSRNHETGVLLARGCSYPEAVAAIGQTVEGVYAARSAIRLAEYYHTEMPIAQEVYRVLFEGKDPRQAVTDLMLREKRIEGF